MLATNAATTATSSIATIATTTTTTPTATAITTTAITPGTMVAQGTSITHTMITNTITVSITTKACFFNHIIRPMEL